MENFARLQQLFLDYLIQNPFQSSPTGLYEPVNYILRLGGKRIRPVLLLLGTQLFDEKVEKALPAAFAVELFHNFSLLHDDIMDEAPLRRGKPTVHGKYGVNTGILSGDVMLVYVYKYLLNLEASIPRVSIFEVFTQVAIEVCEGQQYDMEFENRNDVSIEEYLKMIELKTAILLAGALKIGCLIGGGTEADARHLYEFGRNIGLAFQLQDDILDTFGDPEKFGKKVGGDIAQNKKTFLFLKAMELADDKTKSNLQKLYYGEAIEEKEKIEKVKEVFNFLNVRGFAEEIKESYLQEAFLQLDAVAVPADRKSSLKILANHLMGREN